jgi:hypothetical protein
MLRIPPRWRRAALTLMQLERRLTPAGGIAAGSGWTVWNPAPAAGVAVDLPATVWQPTANGVVARQDQAGPQWILPLALDESALLSALSDAPAESDYLAGDKPLTLALPRPDGAAVTLSANPAGASVVLTFLAGPVEFGSLADGRYTLTVAAAGINQGGLAADFTLVGNPANGLFRLFGDADGNGTADTADFLAFRTAFLGTSPVFDFDGNGTVDAGDFLRFRVRLLQSV